MFFRLIKTFKSEKSVAMILEKIPGLSTLILKFIDTILSSDPSLTVKIESGCLSFSLNQKEGITILCSVLKELVLKVRF